MTVRLRYAPSPTGDPHVGNIRTALWSWLHVRHHGVLSHPSPCPDRPIEKNAIQVASEHLIPAAVRGKFFNTLVGLTPPDGMTPAAHEPGLVDGR